MKTVWKYTIDLSKDSYLGRGFLEFEIPEISHICHVGPEPGSPTDSNLVCFWAIVDTDSPKVVRRFKVHGTGHLVEGNAKIIGSVIIYPFAWHLFELLKTNAPSTQEG